MLDVFGSLIGQISNLMYSYILIIMLLAVGVYFTFRSKFVQLRMLGESIRVVGEKSDDKNAVSAFEALMGYSVNAMYTDVPADQWYYGAVDFVTRYGIMNGVGFGAFDAAGNVNRAQFVTILYRIAGEPEVTIDNPFEDVPAGTWYTNAVLWAFEKGITTGADAKHFNPGDTLVRQNMVTFLMRFAKVMGVDTSACADLSVYTDAGQVMAHAQEAMSWAVAEGIISGMSADTLAPNGLANRAQIATIIQRFVQNKLW